MLPSISSISSTAPLRQCLALRRISTTALQNKWKLVESTEGNTTTVKAVKLEDTEPRKPEDRCALCTCNIPLKLQYTDILVLEQFMRSDGTVLPRQLTGVCRSQQLRLERCVMQAHWAGLFPDRTIPEFDRAGYKRFSRYWKDNMSMYYLNEKKEIGTWYYLKRYPSKNSQTWKRLQPS